MPRAYEDLASKLDSACFCFSGLDLYRALDYHFPGSSTPRPLQPLPRCVQGAHASEPDKQLARRDPAKKNTHPFFKSRAIHESDFLAGFGHIAQGDRYFAPLHDSNHVHALPRLYIHVDAHCGRFWGSWKGFGAHKAPPRRAFGALYVWP